MLLPAGDTSLGRVWIAQRGDAEPVEYIRADIALRGRLLGIIESMAIA